MDYLAGQVSRDKHNWSRNHQGINNRLLYTCGCRVQKQLISCCAFSSGGAVTHQSCSGFSIGFHQADLIVLLLSLLVSPFAAALDADTQAADDDQQSSHR